MGTYSLYFTPFNGRYYDGDIRITIAIIHNMYVADHMFGGLSFLEYFGDV